MASGLESTLWAGITFVAGVVVKTVSDGIWKAKQDRERYFLEKRTALLEQQLSRFYWPLYLHLEKDNLIWERLLEREQDPESPNSRLSLQIESEVILPNHVEAVQVIEGNIHLAGNPEVVSLVLRYIRHVKVYATLRAAGIKSDPVSHGEPYPKDVFPIIKKHLERLQAEYDSLIA